ncbi:type II toxin-antitoxin system VapC family toxin [Luteolibacter sp. Populi]|uniref:type II toxin-antitoxin system VapC family toxin n=1 Tax=Luteolibacter sp. Populi TaxID=3230487 RepID=UPI003465E1A5
MSRRLLLDTHVLVWAEEGRELGKACRAMLLDPRNEIFVSPVTTLELARLASLGRLVFKQSLGRWLDQARQHLQFRDAVLSHEVAIESYALPGEFHRDPADRMLVGTARAGGYALVTADDLILAYPHVEVVDARR